MKTQNYNNLGKTYVKYVSSNVLGMIGISFYILADTFFVAKGAGSNGLAALNIAIPVFGIMYGLGLMMGMGSATRYSILHATEEKKEANRYFTQSLITLLLVSMLFVLMGILIPEQVSKVLGADRDTIEYTVVYVRTVLIFAPMFTFEYYMLCFIRNDGNPRLAMYAVIAGSIANVIFDYIFIFTMGLGMSGAALATGMSPVTAMLIMSTHIIGKHNQFHFVRHKFEFRILSDTVRLGFSSFINEISSSVAILVFNYLILKIAGIVGVAAYGVVANIALVITSLFTGIGQGIQPMVSHYYGKGDVKKMQKTYRYALVTALCMSIAAYGFILVFRQPLVAAFNGENNLLLAKIAKTGMAYYFIGFIPSGFNIVASFYLTASEQAAKGLTISILRGLVLIVLFAVCLAWILKMTGVWLAFPCAEAVTALVAAILVRKNNRKLEVE